jgi:hypothetical protein
MTQINFVCIFVEQEATQFEYQLMQQSGFHTYQTPNQLSASSSADQHVGEAAVSGGPALKQLPTLFLWDFKTTTVPPGVKSVDPASSTGTAPPQQQRSAVTKGPRITVAAGRQTKPAATTTTTTVPVEVTEEASTVASRIPKIYLNNPKIDPFTESPAVAPQVQK